MVRLGYRFFVVLLMLAFAVGCRRAVELIDAKAVKDTSLEPIDLVLKIVTVAWPQPINDPFAAPQSEVISQDRAMGVTITRSVDTRTPEVDEVIKDLNIFLFHKERDTIVRHYYIVNANPALPIAEIHLDNLYVGNYDLYVIANNGRSLCVDHTSEFGCTHHRADMIGMMCSVIPVNQTPYFNLMTYRNDSFTIKRADQEFAFELQRLTSAFEVEFVNNWSINRADYTEYISLDNYSIMNLPTRTALFSAYKPIQADMDNRINIAFSGDVNSSPQVEQLTMMNNRQGNIAWSANPSYRDRNIAVAPENASYIILYATYVTSLASRKSISYHLYLGGPGERKNNYDVVGGNKYKYTVTFNQPDLTDPRITSMNVLNERSMFVDSTRKTSNFSQGTLIFRSLEIECSRLKDDELMISCENTINKPPQNYLYSVYAVFTTSGAKKDTVLVGQGAPIQELKLPVTSRNETTKMSTVTLYITYYQAEAGDSNLSLSLKTSQGQLYQIRPSGPFGPTHQSVKYL